MLHFPARGGKEYVPTVLFLNKQLVPWHGKDGPRSFQLIWRRLHFEGNAKKRWDLEFEGWTTNSTVCWKKWDGKVDLETLMVVDIDPFGCFQKIGGNPPNHPLNNRVGTIINHQFWWFSHYFWFNIHLIVTWIFPFTFPHYLSTQKPIHDAWKLIKLFRKKQGFFQGASMVFIYCISPYIYIWYCFRFYWAMIQVYCTHSHSLCNHLTALLFTMTFEPSVKPLVFNGDGCPCGPTQWQKCHNQRWQHACSEAAESSSRGSLGHRHWAADRRRSGALAAWAWWRLLFFPIHSGKLTWQWNIHHFE